MKDFMSNNEEEIRDETLNVKTYPLSTILEEEDDIKAMNEEAHYVHTINAFVELIVVYGHDKVMNDLKTVIGWKKT